MSSVGDFRYGDRSPFTPTVRLERGAAACGELLNYNNRPATCVVVHGPRACRRIGCRCVAVVLSQD